MTQSLPSGWSLRPIKHVATCNDEVLSEKTSPEREIAYIDIGNVKHGLGVTAFETTTFSSAPSRARRLVRNGDVIASTVRTYLRAIARIENPKEDVVVSTGFAVLRPGSLLISRFFGYAMQCEHLIDEIVAHSTGVSYPAIAASDLVRLKIPFPEVATQNAISDFLDRETAEADALVAKYERLIELLEEKRVALITQAVTKGLDPTVPMRDSGVAWIGNIPTHWGCPATSTAYEVSLGKMLDEKKIAGHHLMPYLRVADVQWGHINTADLPVMDIRADEYKRYLLNTGDLLICEGGSYPGRSAIWFGELDCAYQKALHRLRSRHTDAYPPFMLLVMRLVTESGWLLADQGKSTIAHVPREDLKRLRVPLPPRVEQEQIVAHVDRMTRELDTLTVSATSAISLLNERRSALITAAVTGQIDVTTYGSKQPTEVPA